jgi:hypothetical protein
MESVSALPIINGTYTVLMGIMSSGCNQRWAIMPMSTDRNVSLTSVTDTSPITVNVLDDSARTIAMYYGLNQLGWYLDTVTGIYVLAWASLLTAPTADQLKFTVSDPMVSDVAVQLYPFNIVTDISESFLSLISTAYTTKGEVTFSSFYLNQTAVNGEYNTISIVPGRWFFYTIWPVPATSVIPDCCIDPCGCNPCTVDKCA